MLEDFGITQQALKEDTMDEFIGKCMLLAEANVKDLYKLLES